MPPFTNQLNDDEDDDTRIGLVGRFAVTEEDVEDVETNGTIHVPLVGIRVEAKVIDFIAEVKQSLCYHNTEAKPIEATYHFPVDPAAAVCGFQAEYEDGTIIEGIVKEKEQARQEYNVAMQSGKQANLLETVRRDLFSLQVGNVPAGGYVKISLTYVTYLKAQDHAVAFVIPTTIAPRYSPATTHVESPLEPQAMAPPTSSIKWFGLDIGIDFTMRSDIQSLTCPSHASEPSCSCQYTGKTGHMHLQDIPMDREVVTLVQEKDCHQPRVIVEDNGTTKAGFVTLFPQLEFPDLVREFIFLVDQSGSMSGSKIQQVRETLLLFLRALPATCTFNLIGFGSHFETLFDAPIPYSDKTLEYATSHVRNLQANLGGTEIKAPLEHVFCQKPPAAERQVFVLTDGQVSNDLQVFDVIRKHCSAGSKPKCRLFSVGVGSGVSRHLVEGMARAGCGTSRFVESGESLEAKVLGQLKQALQPALDNVSIQWNFPVQKPAAIESSTEPPAVKTLLGYCSAFVDNPPAPTQPKIKIFPSINPPVFNKERYLSFVMFPSGCDMPESVRVSCETPDGTLDVTLPIQEDEIFQGTIARKMAAHAAISEYEDTRKARGQYYGSHFPAPVCAITDAEALDLALENNLASQKTSFVAIRKCAVVQPGTERMKKVIPQFVSPLEDHVARLKCLTIDIGGEVSQQNSLFDEIGDASSLISLNISRMLNRGEKLECLASKSDQLSAQAKVFKKRSTSLKKQTAWGRFLTAFTGRSGGSCPRTNGIAGGIPSIGKKMSTSKCVPGQGQQGEVSRSVQPSKLQNSPSLFSLCLLQKADGSFEMNDALAQAVGLTVSKMCDMLAGVCARFDKVLASNLFATAFAVVAMRVLFAKDKNVWELQEEKAIHYLKSNMEPSELESLLDDHELLTELGNGNQAKMKGRAGE